MPPQGMDSEAAGVQPSSTANETRNEFVSAPKRSVGSVVSVETLTRLTAAVALMLEWSGSEVFTDSFDDCALEIVVEELARHSAEERKRRDVTSKEAVHSLVEREANERCSTVREHHHERRHPSLPAHDIDGSEVAPVHLLPCSSRRKNASRVRLGRTSAT